MNLTPEEASARLRIPEKTLANWRNKRIGPSYIKFGRRVLYPLDKLIEYERKSIVETQS